MRIQSFTKVLFVLVVMTALASVASAQAAPTCGVPGAPVCTSTPEPTRQRPTDAPTQAPPAEQPAQPTAAPTAEPTVIVTELPLLALPATDACIASPNGHFRVNVRDIPSTDGEIVAVLGENDAVLVLGVFTNDGGEDWLLTLPGYVLASAMRYSGEDCDDTTAAKLAKATRVVIRIDFAAINEDPDAAAGLYRGIVGRETYPAGSAHSIYRTSIGRATDEQECYPADVMNAAGQPEATVCLPFPQPLALTVCRRMKNGNEVCYFLLSNTAAETDTQPAPLDTIFQLPDGSEPEPEFPLALIAVDLPEETEGNVYHGTTGGDVCIEYNYANPWGGGGSFCLAADLGAGDVACIDGHCVVIVD